MLNLTFVCPILGGSNAQSSKCRNKQHVPGGITDTLGEPL